MNRIKKLILNLIIIISLFSCQKESIKCLEDVKVGSVIDIHGNSYKVVDEIMLKKMIANNEDITYVCTSKITDMSEMFKGSQNFNGDISRWDVSNVTNMQGMFSDSKFNGDISNWDVSNVTNMANMFLGASSFNQPIGSWDVSNVTDMSRTFRDAISFEQPICDWDVSNVTTMRLMLGCVDCENTFNKDISRWNVSNVTDMAAMFQNNTAFNQSIGNWDVSNVTNMSNMFFSSKFNREISNWDVSNVTDMAGMFQNNTAFNQSIGNWDVSNVSSMFNMFSGGSFNGDISNWVNKPEIVTNSFIGKKVAMDHLNNLNLSNILWLHDEGYVGGVCTGKPNQYCGRVTKFHNGQYWTYDIIVFVEWDYNGKCKVKGTWNNL